MNTKQDKRDLVDLGVATEETRGNIPSGQEAGGLVKNHGLSDED